MGFISTEKKATLLHFTFNPAFLQVDIYSWIESQVQKALARVHSFSRTAPVTPTNSQVNQVDLFGLLELHFLKTIANVVRSRNVDSTSTTEIVKL